MAMDGEANIEASLAWELTDDVLDRCTTRCDPGTCSELSSWLTVSGGFATSELTAAEPSVVFASGNELGGLWAPGS